MVPLPDGGGGAPCAVGGGAGLLVGPDDVAGADSHALTRRTAAKAATAKRAFMMWPRSLLEAEAVNLSISVRIAMLHEDV
jgi:hypothetical protein